MGEVLIADPQAPPERARPTLPARPHLGIVLLLLALAILPVALGLTASKQTMNGDLLIYRDTLVEMQAGKGYYDATRDAMVLVQGVAPRSVRAIRPPTLFLFLRWFPEGSWPLVAGFVYLATLLAAWTLGARYGPKGSILATVGVLLWIIGASRYYYLHSEMWGAPFFLWGIDSVRREKDGRAAVLLTIATCLRELFGLGLLVGLFVGRRKRPWATALGVVAIFGVWHLTLAKHVLSLTGWEAPMGNMGRTLSHALSALSPGDHAVGWIFGIPLLVLGATAMVRHRETDPAARFVLAFAIIMIVATIYAMRAYWGLTYGPAIAVFAPGAFRFGRASPPVAA